MIGALYLSWQGLSAPQKDNNTREEPKGTTQHGERDKARQNFP